MACCGMGPVESSRGHEGKLRQMDMGITMRVRFGALAIIAAMAAAIMAWQPAHAEPKLTEQSPQYGDVLQTLPESLHLCFSEPVKVEQSPDWKFDVKAPDGRSLGLRIVFQPSGDCVDVYPGAPEEPPQGIWTFEWLVHAQSDNSEGSGVIKFQLGELQPGETPLPTPKATEAPDNGSGDGGGGSSTGMLVAIGVGATLIIAASAGFVISRRRSRP